MKKRGLKSEVWIKKEKEEDQHKFDRNKFNQGKS